MSGRIGRDKVDEVPVLGVWLAGWAIGIEWFSTLILAEIGSYKYANVSRN